MAAKTNKTRVTLPGSLADLVRDLQDGGAQGVRSAQDAVKAEQEETKAEEQVVDNQPKTTADRVGDNLLSMPPLTTINHRARHRKKPL